MTCFFKTGIPHCHRNAKEKRNANFSVLDLLEDLYAGARTEKCNAEGSAGAGSITGVCNFCQLKSSSKM